MLLVLALAHRQPSNLQGPGKGQVPLQPSSLVRLLPPMVKQSLLTSSSLIFYLFLFLLLMMLVLVLPQPSNLQGQEQVPLLLPSLLSSKKVRL
jgi:hypothetical protein